MATIGDWPIHWGTSGDIWIGEKMFVLVRVNQIDVLSESLFSCPFVALSVVLLHEISVINDFQAGMILSRYCGGNALEHCCGHDGTEM